MCPISSHSNHNNSHPVLNLKWDQEFDNNLFSNVTMVTKKSVCT